MRLPMIQDYNGMPGGGYNAAQNADAITQQNMAIALC